MKDKIKLIHIGKCGGTFVQHNFNLKQYHLSRDYKNNEKYIIWIRNPISRFVSAFWFSYNIINLNINELDISNLTYDNCLSPYRIHYAIINKTKYIFSERYDYLINHFKSPNHLAESLTSDNIEEKKLAFELMTDHNEHIYKSIGWYLHNGQFIEEKKDKIIFVGTMENMNEDIVNLSKLIGKEIKTMDKIRNNRFSNDNWLSKTAIQNIYNFYKDTDYKALETLLKHKYITKKIYDDYHQYDYIYK
jgi:hypothetical protein